MVESGVIAKSTAFLHLIIYVVHVVVIWQLSSTVAISVIVIKKQTVFIIVICIPHIHSRYHHRTNIINIPHPTILFTTLVQTRRG